MSFTEIVDILEQLVVGAEAEREIHNAKIALHRHLQVESLFCVRVQ